MRADVLLRLGEGEVERARKGRRREETEGEEDRGERQRDGTDVREMERWVWEMGVV